MNEKTVTFIDMKEEGTVFTHILGGLETEVKNLTTDYGGNGIYSTNMVVFEARRQVNAHIIMSFTRAA